MLHTLDKLNTALHLHARCDLLRLARENTPASTTATVPVRYAHPVPVRYVARRSR